MGPRGQEAASLPRQVPVPASEAEPHLHHLEDALWVQAALPHFSHARHDSRAGHGHQQAGQGAGLLLKSSVHDMPIADLQSQGSRAHGWVTCIPEPNPSQPRGRSSYTSEEPALSIQGLTLDSGHMENT